MCAPEAYLVGSIKNRRNSCSGAAGYPGLFFVLLYAEFPLIINIS